MQRIAIYVVVGLLLLALPLGAQDPTEVDSKHYKTVFENDQVRVLRITYGPHEKSVMHQHPAGVAVFLTDQHGRFTFPDGTSDERTVKAGEVWWTEAEAHLPENLSDEPLGVILVEMKAAKDEEAAIRQSAEDWEDAANAKDIDRLVGLYTHDASLFPPNGPIVTGSEGIRSVWSQFLDSPGFASSLETTMVEISRSGDLAYAAGTYEDTMKDAGGNPVTDRGKWVTVSKKQPDGTWKVIADIWNSDELAPAPAAE